MTSICFENFYQNLVMELQDLYDKLKCKYDKLKLKKKKLWDKLSTAEVLLYDLNQRECEHCTAWTCQEFGFCARCCQYLCEECSDDLRKCNMCGDEFCRKCCIYPPMIPGNYVCENCNEESISNWIPDHCNKLPQYYRKQLMLSLMIFNRMTHKPPKFIRFLILNFIFEGKSSIKELAIKLCPYTLPRRDQKTCLYPIFDDEDYCRGCLQREFVMAEVKKRRKKKPNK